MPAAQRAEGTGTIRSRCRAAAAASAARAESPGWVAVPRGAEPRTMEARREWAISAEMAKEAEALPGMRVEGAREGPAAWRRSVQEAAGQKETMERMAVEGLRL